MIPNLQKVEFFTDYIGKTFVFLRYPRNIPLFSPFFTAANCPTTDKKV